MRVREEVDVLLCFKVTHVPNPGEEATVKEYVAKL